MKRIGWRGYNFSRTIDGSMIPQRVQNLVIRNYCQLSNLTYLLSATEYAISNSYMMLYSIFEELKSIEGIVMYSVHMLPEKASTRNEIYKQILEKGAALRFALEELVILSERDIAAIEELMVCKELISQVKVSPEYLLKK